MKMNKLLPLLCLLFAGSAFSYDNQYYSNHLHKHAKQFERASWHLVKEFRYATGYTHITRDMRKLAKRASRLHDTIEEERSNRRVRRQFRKISRKFHHLTESIREAHHLHHRHGIRHDVKKMKKYFYKLQAAMQNELGYGNHHRHHNRDWY